VGIIDQILEDDKSQPKKQRHTAKRIRDRLKEEHGFGGGQARVHELMSRARLVILRAAHTEGFWWEVEQVVHNLRPEQIVFVLPFGKKGYNRFRLEMNKLVPRPLPEYARMPHVLGLRGVLYFGEDWMPRLQRARRPFYLRWVASAFLPFVQYIGPSKPMVPIFKRALQPILDQQHLQWLRPPKPHHAFYLGVTAGAVALAVLGSGLDRKMAKDANHYYDAGAAFEARQDYAKAIAAYRRAQRFDPDGVQSYLKIGLVDGYEEKWDQAVAEFTTAVRMRPDMAIAHFVLGSALVEKGDHEKAICRRRRLSR
jgi:hypothetical protein